ncbi:MAG: SoxR reducing system RseC family protein [Oscillospiraceae bacterium]|nr:SoxR reducing system RseC family protein [Oscillospiraceae bacterium]
MRQIVQVKKIIDSHHAEIFLERPSACGGNCHDCGGCGGESQSRIVIATAENPIGARVGDKVYIESDTKVIFSAIFLVYLVPLVLFFVGYAIGHTAGFLPAVCGGAGFVGGICLAIAYNRYVEKHKTVSFRITAFA